MKPRLIIFDFDGTLADTTATILETCSMATEALGIEPRTDAQWQSTIGLPLKACFRAQYPEFTDAQIEHCADVYRRVFEENKARLLPDLYPGVKQTLDELERMGIIMSIASSRSTESLIEFCDYTGISNYFSLILGADNVTHAKPAPEPVLITLERLGLDADTTLVVGDMPVDIAMGNAAKCHTVGVTYGNSSKNNLIKAGANYIIDAFPELLSRVIFE